MLKVSPTKTEKQFMLYFFTSRLWFHVSIWVIFFQSKGYNLSEIAFINIFMWGSIIVFEIPTGYIADLFGRKISLILSYIVQSLGIGLFVISDVSYVLIASSIIWGIGITMSSGAETAWIYDETLYHQTLVEKNSENEANVRFQYTYGILVAIAHISLALGTLLGGVLASIELWLPHSTSVVLFLISATILTSIPETKNNRFVEVEEAHEIEEERPRLLDAIGEARKPIIIAIVLVLMVVHGLDAVLYWMQDYLFSEGITLTQIGVYFTFGYALNATGSAWNTRVNARLKNQTLLILISVLALSFLFMSLSPLFLVLVLFLLTRLIIGLLRPIISRMINERISSTNRATVLSISGIFNNISFSGIQLTTAYFIVQASFEVTFLLVALLITLICIPAVFFVMLRRSNHAISGR